MGNSEQPNRDRWIVIGVVRTGWFMRCLQWGAPGTLLMTWRGGTHVFQEREFWNWEQLRASVCGRLQWAGLELVAIACDVQRKCCGFGSICNPEGQWEMAIHVLVRRSKVEIIF